MNFEIRPGIGGELCIDLDEEKLPWRI